MLFLHNDCLKDLFIVNQKEILSIQSSSRGNCVIKNQTFIDIKEKEELSTVITLALQNRSDLQETLKALQHHLLVTFQTRDLRGKVLRQLKLFFIQCHNKSNKKFVFEKNFQSLKNLVDVVFLSKGNQALYPSF